jgi:hypothetical protein
MLEYGFERLFQVPSNHRLELIRSRGVGGRVHATYWDHEEFDPGGHLIARYRTFEEFDQQGGANHRSWCKYDTCGQLLGEAAL